MQTRIKEKVLVCFFLGECIQEELPVAGSKVAKKQEASRGIFFKNRTENNSQKEVQKLRYDSTNP